MQLREELAPCRELPGVVDVRVMGAIGVVQLAPPLDLDQLRVRFVDQGVWVRPFRDIVYLTPAFIIEPSDLTILTRAVVDVVRSWSATR